MSGQADRWIRRTTIGCVALLALIAGTVSYLHMHGLVALHGQPGWVAALTPLSVDGMIVAASTTLLSESRSGRRGGLLPWTLLVAGSIASLAANVAVAEPTLLGRVIAAWPSFALTASYELLTRQVRRGAAADDSAPEWPGQPGSGQRDARKGRTPRPGSLEAQPLLAPAASWSVASNGSAVRALQRQAWEWALANRHPDGSLPAGREIARQHGRHERWGRLVKRAGLAGEFAHPRSTRESETHVTLQLPAPS